MRRASPLIAAAALFAATGQAQSAEPGCGQSLVDGTTPPTTSHVIQPRAPSTPFYQWENNNGYCGEVSLMQAGLANGQWVSQYNIRLLCGTGLSQSGIDGQCAEHDATPNYNAQLLIEDPNTGVTGPAPYADAAQCIGNARLAGITFPYQNEPSGMDGYRQYMSWVKAQLIAGSQVTVAVLYNGGTDPQYDHEVTVLKIGTNHAPTDPTYYPDDVLYFDDHGAYTLAGLAYTTNPAIPPGAGTNTTACTPYVFGYRFGDLAGTRAAANFHTAHAYTIILPGTGTVDTMTGGTGYTTVPILGPRNYAFAVSGPADPAGETLPLQITIALPTLTAGLPNPPDPVALWNYENPMIGRSVHARSCTNAKPAPMTNLVLNVTAQGLQPGHAYNLYEYVQRAVSGTGNAAALAVPVRDFNAHAAQATHVTGFSATGTTFSTSVTTTSDRIVVFRMVPADGP